jgi:opacity protein-like surface antigen
MRLGLFSTVCLATLTLASQANADSFSSGTYDWSGFYVGGLVGYGESRSKQDMSYTSGSATPAEGWVDGEFHGNVYNTIDSLTVSSDFLTATNGDMPSLTAWPNNINGNDGQFNGTALFGYNAQQDNLVFGTEFRASFGDFGASNSSAWQDFGTRTGAVAHDVEGTNDFSYVDYGSVLTPADISNSFLNSEGVSYTAGYHQDVSLRTSSEFNLMIAPVARIGVASEQAHFFLMGGPSYARVKSKTSATINEYTSDAAVNIEFMPSLSFNATDNYEFSGSSKQNLWGYTVGGGTEWAITEQTRFRIEAEYHDLGTTQVTGRSPETDATFTVKQKHTGYSISTGITLKF